MDIKQLMTELSNPKTKDIDEQSTLNIVRTINEEDSKVPKAIEKALPQIGTAVDTIVATLKKGGRLIYIGAGTSGRLGVLDASECPPTYGIPQDMVVGIIAGGDEALRLPIEGAEDHAAQGKNDVKKISINDNDVLVGIAASGRTPYTIGALEYANQVGAATVAVVCTENSPMSEVADITIAPLTGPEVVAGSTRMKAGSAQKMVLNMLTTAAMVRIGKVYGNLMVDVQPTNQKLKRRALTIVMSATGVSEREAKQALDQHQGHTKSAILHLMTGLTSTETHELLEAHDGHLKQALQSHLKQ